MTARHTGYHRVSFRVGRYHWFRRRPTLGEFSAWWRRKERRKGR